MEKHKIAIVQLAREGTDRPDIGLGTGYLKSYIQQQRPGRYEIDLFDSNDFERNVVEQADEYDVVGLSSVSHLYGGAKRIAQKIKQHESAPTVVLGGVHVSSLPTSLTSDFDYAALGEGEQTFVDLLDGLNRGDDDEDIIQLPGVCAVRDGTLVQGPQRELIADLNAVPIPDRELFLRYRSVPSLIVSRGCPYRCDFCTNQVMWGRNVRRVSPRYVVEELVAMADLLQPLKVVVFRDDIVFLSADYVEAVAEYAREHHPEIINIRKVGYSHANTLTDRMVRALIDFGVSKILVGFESGSERMIRLLKGGAVSVQQNQSAIDVCNEHGLDIGGNFIIGSPDERVEDIEATYEFIIRNLSAGKLDTVSTSLLTPFPGQRYWDMFTATGVDIDTFDWSRLDEPGYSTFLDDRQGEGTVRDWWDYRRERGNIYMGSLPQEEFLDILQKYEPQVMDLLPNQKKTNQKPATACSQS